MDEINYSNKAARQILGVLAALMGAWSAFMAIYAILIMWRYGDAPNGFWAAWVAFLGAVVGWSAVKKISNYERSLAG